MQKHQTEPPLDDPEPRWPALVAMLAVGGLYEALPKSLYWGPRGFFIALVVVLLIPTVIFRLRGHHHVNRMFSLGVTGLVSLYLVTSVVLLVHATIGGKLHADRLLLSAVILWLWNVLVFALWYWNLDAGGPHQRDLRAGHQPVAFLFPQSMMAQQGNVPENISLWSPNFLDYLFLSFNTSTALSPTDTAVLTRWAKCCGMVQALISLTVVALLAGRAVNILPGS
jgi:hypothetical protein